MSHSLHLILETSRTPLVDKTLEIVTRRLTERGGPALIVQTTATTSADLIFAISAAVGAEAFTITQEGTGAWRVTGGDDRGLLYGAGKFLRGCRLAADGRWTYAGPTGHCAPTLAVRGIYFATHFHNFYHDAPLEQVERYVEELALWGCNALSVWFDMHHYTGIDDPEAQAMIARLHAILKAANGVGMGAALTSLANEAYATSPEELRADPFPHHYHVELCPSMPEGLALILQWRAEMLDAFADLDIEYFWTWPYDQGGCKCDACKPWGGNGFVHNAKAVGQLLRRLLPGTKHVVSTWEFGYWEGDPEWEAFYAAMAAKPDWADYLMAEGHGDFPPYILQHGPPPQFPLLNFPEISMYGMGPWGGFGANLQPRRLQAVWDNARQYLAGGFPYSEGIFEDLNKAICLQLYWNPDRPVEEIVREYAADYAPEAVEAVTEAVYLLEEQMHHNLSSRDILDEWYQAYTRGDGSDQAIPLYQLAKVKDRDAGRPLALLTAAEATMTPAAKAEWRWRMLWLRAALDAELAQSGGRWTANSERWFAELHQIVCADQAEWWVSVPTRESLVRFLRPERAAHHMLDV
jgi:hypothetical protein